MFFWALITLTTLSSVFATTSIDGTVDTSFQVGSWFVWVMWQTNQTMILQGSDKIIVWWSSYTKYQNNSISNIVRLWLDGLYDNSFLSLWFWVITGLNTYYQQVWVLHELFNGKILVGGSFTTQNGITVTGMLSSINSDGTPDTSFQNLGFKLNSALWNYGPVLAIKQ